MSGSDPRTLAHELIARSDAALAALLAGRRIPPEAAWGDPFDAAEHLLDPAGLAPVLAGLSADEAAALSSAVDSGAAPPSPARDRLFTLALLDASGAPWGAVVDALSAKTPAAIPTAAASADAPVPATADAAATSAEHAFLATASLADLLHSALPAGLGRIGAGTLSATDRRRLIEAGAVPDAAAAADLVAIADRAGLLAAEGRTWLVTPRGAAWLYRSTIDRWVEVAEALIRRLPAALHRADGGWVAAPAWPGAYPFDPAWPERAAAIVALWQRWALLDSAGEPTAWARQAASGGELDTGALAELLPPEVDRVYLQNDLTAIAPGILAPHLQMRLRTMALRESRAQASTYRFSADTIADAMTSGETASSMREFLESLSLTGLPQALEYEIARSARRHGVLRVGPDWHGRTRVSGEDPALLQTLVVDQALRPLGLVADGDGLITRASPDTAFWMIADARYPIIPVDADGRRRALDRHRLAAEQPPAPDAEAGYAALIGRLRAATNADTDSAWLERELDQAVRARRVIQVTVRLRDGTERDFTIEATGLASGRLRGLDQGVDVERTLPVSSILRIQPG